MSDTKPMPPAAQPPAIDVKQLTKERDALATRIREIEKADAKVIEENAKLAKANADAGARIKNLEQQIDALTGELKKAADLTDELMRKNDQLRGSAAKSESGRPKAGAFRPWRDRDGG